MQDSPDALTILAEVEAALKTGLGAGLPQRMAANAVALARRELALAGGLAEGERRRLTMLLRADGEPSALNARLADAIRRRELTATAPGLVDHLWLTSIEKLRVDQPGYPAFIAATAANSREGQS